MGNGPYEEKETDGKRSFRVPRSEIPSENLEENKEAVFLEEEAPPVSSAYDGPTQRIATDIFEQFPSQFEGGYSSKEEDSIEEILKKPSSKESVETLSTVRKPVKSEELPLSEKSIPGTSPYIKGPQSKAPETQALLSKFHDVMRSTGEIQTPQGGSFLGDSDDYDDYDDYDEDFEGDYAMGFWERFQEKRARRKEEKKSRKSEKYEEEDYEEENEEYENDFQYGGEEIYAGNERSQIVEEYDFSESVKEPKPKEAAAEFRETVMSSVEERTVNKEEEQTFPLEEIYNEAPITFEIEAQKAPSLLSSQAFQLHGTKETVPLEEEEDAYRESEMDQTSTGTIRRIHAKNGVDEATPRHPESLIIERPEDYKSTSQKAEKAEKLDAVFSRAGRKVVALLLLSIISIYFSVSRYYVLPIPHAVDPFSEPFNFLVANLILLVGAVLISLPSFIEATKGFFILRPNKSSMLAVATIFAMIQVLCYFPGANQILTDGVQIYAPVVIAGWFFHQLGHLLNAARIQTNFGVVSSDKIKYHISSLPASPFVDEVIRYTSNPDVQALAPVETTFLQRYLELSADDNNLENDDDVMARWLPYVVFGTCLMVSFFAWLILSSFTVALTLFVGLLAISATYSAVFQNAYPQYRASLFLAPKGAFISSIDTLEYCAETSSIVIDASELFPKGSVVLQGLRTFEGGRIDEAITDAASVMNAMGGTLADLFFSIIEYRKELLNPVESILYEEGRGIVAWSEGRRVLIGNRQLMRQYGIDAPSNDYESKYRAGGRDLIYVASSGVLTAMYVVLYKGERKVQEALQKITEDKVTLLLRSVDPNVTAEKVIELFDLPENSVILLTDRDVRQLDVVTEPQLRADADMGFTDRLLGYLGVVTTSIRFYTTLTVTRLMERIGVLLGFAMLVGSAFFAKMVGITPLLLIVYNSAWLILIWLMGKFRKI